MKTPSGIEALVCQDIGTRQQAGIRKYGCTVSESPDDMLQHAYEEAIDLAVYLKARIEREKLSTRALATKIATALLTPGGGPECDSLQIMQQIGPLARDERNMGGWCKGALIDQITEILS